MIHKIKRIRGDYMAKKKFLVENDTQVWPITRADCVYHTSGNELLSSVVDDIIKNLLAEVERAKAAEKANTNRIANLEALMLEENDLSTLLDNIFKG
jgi:hypothetical protein